MTFNSRSIFSALHVRMQGPGGLYNIGDVLGFGVGLAVGIAGARGRQDIASAAENFVAGSPAAVAFTAATAIFLWSGEQYHQAWKNGFPPDPREEPLGGYVFRHWGDSAGPRAFHAWKSCPRGDFRVPPRRRQIRQRVGSQEGICIGGADDFSNGALPRFGAAQSGSGCLDHHRERCRRHRRRAVGGRLPPIAPARDNAGLLRSVGHCRHQTHDQERRGASSNSRIGRGAVGSNASVDLAHADRHAKVALIALRASFWPVRFRQQVLEARALARR